MPALPFPVVLASASPRRVALLSELIPEFEVLPPDVHEQLPEHGDPCDAALEWAWKKARWAFARRRTALVIAGDTVVALAGPKGHTLLAKPADEREAEQMLLRLSGNTHVVSTAVVLIWPGGERSFCEKSCVTFRALGRDEIETYIRTGEPFDKAGGYGLQGMGASFVEHVKGHHSTVVGLPVERLRAVVGEVFPEAFD